MTTPFTSFANLSVVFEVPTGLAGLNVTGNEALQTECLVCTAYVNRRALSQQRNSQLAIDGSELSRVLFEGHWVSPEKAPQGILAEQTGEAITWRIAPPFRLPSFETVDEYETFAEANASYITGKGRFVLAAAPPGPFGVETVLGDRFEGYLLANTVWADSL